MADKAKKSGGKKIGYRIKKNPLKTKDEVPYLADVVPVGTVDLNDQDTALHILCHLDVVGEGTGWTVTAPYEPKEVDGMLYGRGTLMPPPLPPPIG